MNATSNPLGQIKVFCSYRGVDRVEVRAFVDRLIAAGLDAWFDRYEVLAGDDIVQKMNAGLAGCQVGLMFFSNREARGAWFGSEVSTLIHRRVEEGIRLIPVMIDGDVILPALLRPLARRGLEDFEQIVDAIRGISRRPRPGPTAAEPRRAAFTLQLVGPREGRIDLVARQADNPEVRVTGVPLTRRLQQSYADFLQGRIKLEARGPAEAAQATLSQGLVELGEELGAVLFQGAIGEALRGALQSVVAGGSLDLCFQAADAGLLALPFEAARLVGEVPALKPGVRVRRLVEGAQAPAARAVPAPLKILVAIGAPDEGRSGNAVLDLEHELQGLVDALSPRMVQGNADVRMLEVGSPAMIEQALRRDAYHVLHLSGRGGPGSIELEDEDGAALQTTAAELVNGFRLAGKNVPLVFLSACHGGFSAGETTSLAVALVRAGVPQVLAMQTRVTDAYASALAREFYRALAEPEFPEASQALAVARQRLEQERQRAVQRGAPALETQPEYATASLFCGGDEAPLVDYSADKQPLSLPTVHRLAGPVPMLSIGELVGRRSELRAVLRVLRDQSSSVEAIGKRAGVVLTGIGGVGKSSLAGRAMMRLKEDGWAVAAIQGKLDLGALAVSLGFALVEGLAAAPNAHLAQVAADLRNTQFDDQQRFRLLLNRLQTQRILLVLDNFEDNLVVGGGQYKDESVPTWLGLLCQSATLGKLLITSRYPLPGLELQLAHQPLGPLSPAQVRKLMWRHPGLKALTPADAREVLRHIGGHPRMLEFLDGILRGGTARLPHIAKRLRDLAQQTGIDLSAPTDDLDSAVRSTAQLGARDILLDELLKLARAAGDEPALLQAAVSSLPVKPRDLAHAINDAPPSAAQVRDAQLRLERLAELSLVSTHKADQDATGDANHAPFAFWVHRWTAEALAAIGAPEEHRTRHARAGRARLARGTKQRIALEDIVEATHNFLAAELWDEASELALQIADHLVRTNQSIAAAVFCAQILRELPKDHGIWAALADVEARGLLALGFTSVSLARSRYIHEELEQRLGLHPDRAECQQNLSVSHERLGDLLSSLGLWEQARGCYRDSLNLRERLAQREPERAEYQRDLSVLYNKLGNLLSMLDHVELARGYYEGSLRVRERLAQAEPDRAEYRQDLAVAYTKQGDLMNSCGQKDQAQEYYERSLSIWSKLMALDPSQVDYQRGCSVPLERLGDQMSALDQGMKAWDYYKRSLEIRERVAKAEPARADYQRELVVSYIKLGDLLNTIGHREQAQAFYERSLQLIERLAHAEPDRADYQRDLVVSLVRSATQLGRVADAERAVAILHRLRDTGRLAPVDAGMVGAAEELRDRLAKGGGGGHGLCSEPGKTLVPEPPPAGVWGKGDGFGGG